MLQDRNEIYEEAFLKFFFFNNAVACAEGAPMRAVALQGGGKGGDILDKLYVILFPNYLFCELVN